KGTEIVPGYVLVRRLGAGMAGEVWVARASGGVEVAIKIIRDLEMIGSKRELGALRIVREVKHPNLCPLIGVWFFDEHDQILSSQETDAILGLSSSLIDTASIQTQAGGPEADGAMLETQSFELGERGSEMQTDSGGQHSGLASDSDAADQGPTTNKLPPELMVTSDSSGFIGEGNSATNQTFRQASDATTVVAHRMVLAMGLGEKTLHDRLTEMRAPPNQPQQEDDAKHIPGGIPVEELLGYMRASASAIDELNQKHAIYHCDIKPQNILVVGGQAQVCDFGLARRVQDSHRTQLAFGTPAYGAPEMLFDQTYSKSIDQYSLAVTYFELRTGRLPFEQLKRSSFMRLKAAGELDLSAVPPREREVIARATSLDPGARFESCRQFVSELKVATSVDVTPPARFSRATLAVLIAGMVLLLVGMGILVNGRILAPLASVDNARDLGDTASDTLESDVDRSSGPTLSPPVPIDVAPAPSPRESIQVPALQFGSSQDGDLDLARRVQLASEGLQSWIQVSQEAAEAKDPTPLDGLKDFIDEYARLIPPVPLIVRASEAKGQQTPETVLVRPRELIQVDNLGRRLMTYLRTRDDFESDAVQDALAQLALRQLQLIADRSEVPAAMITSRKQDVLEYLRLDNNRLVYRIEPLSAEASFLATIARRPTSPVSVSDFQRQPRLLRIALQTQPPGSLTHEALAVNAAEWVYAAIETDDLDVQSRQGGSLVRDWVDFFQEVLSDSQKSPLDLLSSQQQAASRFALASFLWRTGSEEDAVRILNVPVGFQDALDQFSLSLRREGFERMLHHLRDASGVEDVEIKKLRYADSAERAIGLLDVADSLLPADDPLRSRSAAERVLCFAAAGRVDDAYERWRQISQTGTVASLISDRTRGEIREPESPMITTQHALALLDHVVDRLVNVDSVDAKVDFFNDAMLLSLLRTPLKATGTASDATRSTGAQPLLAGIEQRITPYQRERVSLDRRILRSLLPTIRPRLSAVPRVPKNADRGLMSLWSTQLLNDLLSRRPQQEDGKRVDWFHEIEVLASIAGEMSQDANSRTRLFAIAVDALFQTHYEAQAVYSPADLLSLLQSYERTGTSLDGGDLQAYLRARLEHQKTYFAKDRFSARRSSERALESYRALIAEESLPDSMRGETLRLRSALQLRLIDLEPPGQEPAALIAAQDVWLDKSLADATEAMSLPNQWHGRSDQRIESVGDALFRRAQLRAKNLPESERDTLFTRVHELFEDALHAYDGDGQALAVSKKLQVYFQEILHTNDRSKKARLGSEARDWIERFATKTDTNETGQTILTLEIASPWLRCQWHNQVAFLEAALAGPESALVHCQRAVEIADQSLRAEDNLVHVVKLVFVRVSMQANGDKRGNAAFVAPLQAILDSIEQPRFDVLSEKRRAKQELEAFASGVSS
ncbi:MAG: protein kinase, partial [Planctomycetota bacterium]